MVKISKKRGKKKEIRESKKSDSKHHPVLYKTTVSGIIETDESAKKKKKTIKSAKKTAKKKTTEKTVKKQAKKNISKKKEKKSKPIKSSEEREIEKIDKKISYEREKETNKALTDNFIALQKVMVNLSSKFDNLSTQISKLLELFEISAKSLAQKDFEKDRKDKSSKEILKKLDNISQQAGLIGKGLVLIHEAGGGKEFSPKTENQEDKMEGMQPSRKIKPVPLMTPPISDSQEDKKTDEDNNEQIHNNEDNEEPKDQQGFNLQDDQQDSTSQQYQNTEQQNQENNEQPTSPEMNTEQNQQTNPEPDMQPQQDSSQNQNTEPENNQKNPQFKKTQEIRE